MNSNHTILQELLTLIEDYHDYNPSSVVVHTQSPTAVEFCKQVSKGLPCIYPAATLLKGYKAAAWTKNDLLTKVLEKVEVAVTPNGRADSLCIIPGHGEERVFLQPANIVMTLEELFDKLDDPIEDEGPVYYLQSQNGNLKSTPLAPLFDDLPQNFTFAEDVIGEPEAVNIWIGDERSATSAHRDPYENLYVVLRGSKVFTLWPPVDEVTLDSRMFRTGRFIYDVSSSGFSHTLDENTDDTLNGPPMIPWVTIDPELPRDALNAAHALYKYAGPQTVEVKSGEMLYLPSGWFHHVAQRCGTWDDGSKAPCISVNYWYDQDYEGEKYVMRQLINRLTQQVQQLESRANGD